MRCSFVCMPKMAFGPIPADLCVWRDGHGNLDSARDASTSGQYACRRQLRMLAREAALGEIASSHWRRLLVRGKSFDCTDMQVGDSVILF